ncbi:serpin family protein [Allosalinactinospora lopnorensis]|uniref:serpin family protein n=1 Tax=Allosalinactinospora lopnorensis TaxID=1352348 RepID=UPI000623D54E|nr:serpin family protein [Allosalinactinospora lopnorensis]
MAVPSVSLRPDHLGFALRLHAQMSGSGRSGLVWSPYSVACALGLVATGARGATREELTGLLGGDLEAHLAALDDAVASGPELATSTGLWLRDDLPLRPEFEATVRARPDSGVYTADFPGDPDGVRRTINAEVAKVTNGLISDLLSPGTVQSRTQALLVNALWVRLQWQKPFETDKTARKDFHAPTGTRRVPMMRRRGQIPYAQTRGWRMVSLEGDHDLVLDVLLPDEDHPGAELAPQTLTELQRAASPTEVDLALPRFELTHRAQLSGALTDVGVRTCFTSQADFGGISERPLLIDEVVHQARLRVDEKGAEGAAATAVIMRTAAFTPSKPVVFTADRPFTFVLRRREAILFLGVVADPEDPGPAK